ncbi:transposase [Bhargavaea ginsengi]|nr:transposase [Bhargavaea ginsengi]
MEVETVFGNLKGNLAFRRFLLRGLDKVHVEFGILAMAHNFLKVAGILRMLSAKKHKKQKQADKKQLVFLRLLYLRDLLDSPFDIIQLVHLPATHPRHTHKSSPQRSPPGIPSASR